MSETSEVLRRAAGLMRERASECRPVSWVQNGRNGIHTPVGQCVATTHSHDDAMRKAEAVHIASWHPAVALAVADWLDLVARAVDAAGGMKAATLATQANAYAALDVARKYLGADQ